MTHPEPAIVGDVISDFLDKQTPPYDDEVVCEAFALSALHSVQSIRFAFQGGNPSAADWSHDEVMALFDGMEDHIREVCVRDHITLDRYLGGAVVKRFEYLEVEPPLHWLSREHITSVLNEHGAEGWELVHFDDVIMLFKREILEES